jgi:hypothetical protein
MTLMTSIYPGIKSLDKSLSIKQRSSLFLNLKTGKWLSAKSLIQKLIFSFMTEAIKRFGLCIEIVYFENPR